VQRIWADRGAAIQDDKNQDEAVKPRPVNPHDHLLSKPVCVVETQQRAILIVLLLARDCAFVPKIQILQHRPPKSIGPLLPLFLGCQLSSVPTP
jgi:hypothetical protein